MHLIIQHIGQLLTLADLSPSLPVAGREKGRGRVVPAMSDLGIIEDGLVADHKVSKRYIQ
jgi:hypothetical protein